MVPRVSPGFPENFIEGISRYDGREDILKLANEAKDKFDKFYSDSRATLFFSTASMAFEFLIQNLDFSKGDEVLVSNFNCRSMLEAIVSSGLTPVLYEVNEEFQCNYDQIESLISHKTRMIVVTHFFGRESIYFDKLSKYTGRNVYICEDCAHSLFDQSQPRIGRYSDFSIFSFGNDKPYSVGKVGILRVNHSNLDISAYEYLPIRSSGREMLGFMHALYFSFSASKGVGRSLNPVAPKDFLYSSYCGYVLFYILRFVCSTDAQCIYMLNIYFLFTKFNIDSFYVYRNFKGILRRLQVIKNWKTPIERANKFSIFALGLMNSSKVKLHNTFKSSLCQIYSENLEKYPYLRFPFFCTNKSQYTYLMQQFRLAEIEVGTFNWDYLLSDFFSATLRNNDSIIDVDLLLNIPCNLSVTPEVAKKIKSILNCSFFHNE